MLGAAIVGLLTGRLAQQLFRTPCRWQLHAPPQCHTFLGTVTYMSPERINGQPYSFPADIWALVGGGPGWGGLGSSWKHDQRAQR